MIITDYATIIQLYKKQRRGTFSTLPSGEDKADLGKLRRIRRRENGKENTENTENAGNTESPEENLDKEQMSNVEEWWKVAGDQHENTASDQNPAKGQRLIKEEKREISSISVAESVITFSKGGSPHAEIV